MADDSICLDAPEKKGLGPSKVRIMACSGMARQQWEYDKEVGVLLFYKFYNFYESRKEKKNKYAFITLNHLERLSLLDSYLIMSVNFQLIAKYTKILCAT